MPFQAQKVSGTFEKGAPDEPSGSPNYGWGRIYLFSHNLLQTNPSAEMKAVLESVDRAIETIHAYAARAGGTYTLEQRANLRYALYS